MLLNIDFLFKNLTMIKKIIFTTNFIVAFSVLCCGQTWDWTNFVSQGGNDYVHDVDTDSLGNVYIALRARNEVFFSNNTFRDDSCAIFLPFIGASDMSIAKYDKQGKLLWAKRDGSFDPSVGYGIAVDFEGNVASCGTFYNEFYFGSDTIRSTSPDSAFVQNVFTCKYSKDGDRLWARAGKILNGRDRVNSIGYEIATNSHGDIFTTGLIQGNAVFGSDTIGVAGKQTAFVVAYDKDGNYKWAKNKENWSRGFDIEVNSKNEIIIAGDTGFGQRGIYMDKRSENGDLIWRKESFLGGGDQILSAELDINDNIYFTGIFKNELALDTAMIAIDSEDNGCYLGKLSDEGETQFLKKLLTCDSTIEQIHMDMVVLDNNIIICGAFWGNLFFENDTISSAGDADGFIACFDTLGRYKWVKHLNGKPIRSGGVKNSDGIRGLNLDENNNLLVVGYIKDSIVFDSTIFSGWNGTSGFVAKMFLPIEPQISFDKDAICQGDSLFLQAKGYGAPLTYEWNFDSGEPDNFLGENARINFATPGEFDLQLIVSNPYVSDTILIEDFLVNPNPVVDLGSDTIICENNILLLNAGQGFLNYLWSTGDSTSTIEVNMTDDYLVEVVDSNSCVGQANISVTVDPCTSTDNLYFAEIYTFPNPSYGQFEMEIPYQNCTVSFYDINGILLLKKDLNYGRNSIELSNLNSSLLFYKVSTNGSEIFSSKLVIIQ